jgi:lipopolysaccharide/colanic/teichoic acid biosynthesis glycosyltransferase
VQRNAARHALDRVDVESLFGDRFGDPCDVARRELTPQQRDDVAVLALHTHPCRVALLADGREADVDAQLRRFEEQLLHDGTRFVGGRLDQDSQRKRLMDIVISLIGIVIASPFMFVIALCIKLYDHGPVLYRQERLTKDGEPFMIYKFRSMTTHSEDAGARLAAKGDARITPVGRVIRAIHFDELPQLFNILKGEMSVIGPRPERQIIADQYTEEIPEFVLRLKVKAGLTGYAQVYGKYNTTPYDKLKLDLTYIENYSVWMDIKILFLTFKILFQKENTEGVDQDQTTAIK